MIFEGGFREECFKVSTRSGLAAQDCFLSCLFLLLVSRGLEHCRWWKGALLDVLEKTRPVTEVSEVFIALGIEEKAISDFLHELLGQECSLFLSVGACLSGAFLFWHGGIRRWEQTRYDFPEGANAGPNGWLDSGHLYSVLPASLQCLLL